ncbi:MAG: ribonuclease J [Anaeroplasmataceae bacterium]
MSKINIIGLGGLQENGKNLFVIEVDNDLFVFDAGLKYPTSEFYGVDIIVPDITFLVENKHRIKGIFLTHGHDEHIGSIPQILKNIDVKVYGSLFTLTLVKDTLNEAQVKFNEEKLIEVNSNSVITFKNKMSVRFFEVAHNIPGCLGIVLNTPDGNIVYTGNFSFDQNVKANFQEMYSNITKYSKEGVLALLCECIGTNNGDSRGTIFEFRQRINNIFTFAKGRIVFSLFSNDIQRIQQIIDIAITFKKRVAVLGRKTQKIVNQAINLGYLVIPDEILVNLKFVDETNKNEEEDLVVIVTGERHEPYYMLQRMSKRIDRLVKLNSNDTVVILTVPYLGTEKMASRTLDMLYKVTNNVKQFKNNLLPAPFSSREEVKGMINLLKPKYLVPVIGEYRHQYAFITVATCIGYDKDDIVILDCGDKLLIDNKNLVGIVGDVAVGEVMIDGNAVGDVGDVVMRDRQLLAEDGVMMIVANINPKQKKVVSGPEIVTKGYVLNQEKDFTEDFIRMFTDVTNKHFQTKFINWNDYKNDVKSDFQRFIFKKLKRNPVIIPVLISTDGQNDISKPKKVKTKNVPSKEVKPVSNNQENQDSSNQIKPKQKLDPNKKQFHNHKKTKLNNEQNKKLD